MVFYRNVQFRYTPYRTEHNEFAVAIERPGNDIDAGTLLNVDREWSRCGGFEAGVGDVERVAADSHGADDKFT